MRGRSAAFAEPKIAVWRTGVRTAAPRAALPMVPSIRRRLMVDEDSRWLMASPGWVTAANGPAVLAARPWPGRVVDTVSNGAPEGKMSAPRQGEIQRDGAEGAA